MESQNSHDWRQWLDYANLDKGLGEDAINGGRQFARNVLLCAHQMMEHALKALYLHRNHELPKKIQIHVLPELGKHAKNAGFALSVDEENFLSLLDSYFMPLRYPQSASALPAYEKAVELFKKAAELLNRIEKELK